MRGELSSPPSSSKPTSHSSSAQTHPPPSSLPRRMTSTATPGSPATTLCSDLATNPAVVVRRVSTRPLYLFRCEVGSTQLVVGVGVLQQICLSFRLTPKPAFWLRWTRRRERQMRHGGGMVEKMIEVWRGGALNDARRMARGGEG